LTRGRVCNLQCNDASSVFSYIATDGLSTSLSWCPATFGTSDQMLHLFERQLVYFSCRAPSLTRGRVCNLQCNDASSVSSYIATDGLSTSLSWCPATFGASDQMLHLFEWQLVYFSCRAPSLTRGRVCNLQCNDASSVYSFIATNSLSASSSWCRGPNGARIQILIFLFDSYFVCVEFEVIISVIMRKTLLYSLVEVH
jgi:hypothetical protein